jgi:uncharacterized protein YecE (DUF72 family)
MADMLTSTMGWSYEDWRGTFYEAGLPAAKNTREQFAKVFPATGV